MFQLFVYSQPTWYDFDSTLSWARVSGITLSINFTDLLLSSSSSHSVIPHSPYPSVEKKTLAVISTSGHFKVAVRTGPRLYRFALWGCFGEGILTQFPVRPCSRKIQEAKVSPKQSQSAIEHNTSPVYPLKLKRSPIAFFNLVAHSSKSQATSLLWCIC